MKKTINYDNGTYYTGDVNDRGVPHGQGYIRFPDGSDYVGEFKDNTLTGFGVYRYDDKTTYRGFVVNALREGLGKLETDYGDYKFVAEGSFRRNKYNGTVTFSWIGGISDGVRFEGSWIDGDFQGTGTMYYTDGDVYTGGIDIDNGYSCEGEGVLKTSDGTTYEGMFRDNRRTGVFTVTSPEGKMSFIDFDMKEEPEEEQRQYSSTVRVTETIPLKEIDPEKYLTVEEKDDGYAEELKPYFRGIIGMDSVKQQLDRVYKRFKIDSMRQQLLAMETQKQGYYFIVTGNPGTGKTTVARIIGRMLHDTGILPKDTFVEVDRSKLVGEYIGQTEKKTAQAIEAARGGTLFIDEAYTLYRKDSSNDFGKEAIDTLLKDMEDHRGEYCVILAGYSDQINDMVRNANPGLASRFDHKINIPDYTSEEIVSILVSMAQARNFFIRKEARPVIIQKIEKEKIDDTFDNARFARRLLDEAIERQALRLAENMDNLDISELQDLKAEDFGTLETVDTSLETDLEKLNSLIGLKSVKDEINKVVSSVKIQAESRKRGLKTAGDLLPVNMVFTGNPGTGKTTVARLLGKIYYHLGLLKRNDVFVECGRSDLVGRYQGETALKVKEVVRKALGGVLFIDEAYSLVMGENDTFGLEAVNTLVAEIENNRDKIAVILAGYTEDMQKFLDSNPGLRSRLNKTIEFKDYTLSELADIFRSDMKRRGYVLDVPADSIEMIILEKKAGKDFGNARGVRNICDQVIARHNSRISALNISEISNEVITTITEEDL